MNYPIRFAVLLTALLLTTTQFVFGQFSVGGHIGRNYSSVYASESLAEVLPNLKNIANLQIGLNAEYAVSDNFSLAGELNLLKQGFLLTQGLDTKILGVPLALGTEAETRINYVHVPLLAKYYFGNSQVRAYVAAGPTLGYAIKGNVITRARAIVDIRVGKTPINFNGEDFNRTELGAALSAGVDFSTSYGSLFVDARYRRALTEGFQVPVADEEVYNKGFALSAGIRIPLVQ